MHVIQIKLMLF